MNDAGMKLEQIGLERNEGVVWLRTRIQGLRKWNKVTREGLVLALGVTRQTIISSGNGKYSTSLQLAFKVSGFFGKSIEGIFSFEEEE